MIIPVGSLQKTKKAVLLKPRKLLFCQWLNMHKCSLCIDVQGGCQRGMFCFACSEHDLCDFSPSANSGQLL